jgi:MoaA/NifB/PqqE/SkfB family radical SAM enzyme
VPIPQETRGPTRQSILQVHPTLRCNLQCRHCYSSSGPWAHDELPSHVVDRVLSDAAGLGYQVVSVSGGEPFLYSRLAPMLRRARELGMQTTVTTNGYFLDPRHLDPLRDCLDVLAISLDGPPEMHNQMRASPQAFDRLSAGLDQARASGIRFGFVHTVTRESWIHLLWLAEFAAASGAHLLQLHPIEMAGRAQTELQDQTAQDSVLAKVYLLSAALAAKYAGAMIIQTDLLHRDQVLADPELIYGGDWVGDGAANSPASQLGVLVLEPDGTLVPLTYGFSRRYQVANAHKQPLAIAWPAFLQRAYPALRRLCGVVFERLIADESPPLFNWHEQIALAAAGEGIQTCERGCTAPGRSGVTGPLVENSTGVC